MRKTANTTNATANIVNISPEEMLARNTMSNTYEICGKRIASVPIELMEIDMSYQRILSNTVNKIYNEWRDEACEFLLVSYRDDKFYIIDGQHRMTAAKMKGIIALPCVIMTGLTREQEALMFARQNRNVKKLYPFDTYKANLACGNKDIPEVHVDMEIARICGAHGIEVKKVGGIQTNPKTLRSLTGARNIIRANGSPCFEWIIKTIATSNWNMCSEAYSKIIVGMLRNFYIENVGRMPKVEGKLHSILKDYSPTQIVNRSKVYYSNYGIDTALDMCLKSLMEQGE